MSRKRKHIEDDSDVKSISIPRQFFKFDGRLDRNKLKALFGRDAPFSQMFENGHTLLSVGIHSSVEEAQKAFPALLEKWVRPFVVDPKVKTRFDVLAKPKNTVVGLDEEETKPKTELKYLTDMVLVYSSKKRKMFIPASFHVLCQRGSFFKTVLKQTRLVGAEGNILLLRVDALHSKTTRMAVTFIFDRLMRLVPFTLTEKLGLEIDAKIYAEVLRLADMWCLLPIFGGHLAMRALRFWCVYVLHV